MVQALLIVLLFAASGGRADVADDFLVDGHVEFLRGTSVAGQPLGLFVETGSELNELVLRSESVRVHRLERTYLEPGPNGALAYAHTRHHTSYPLTDVTLRLISGDHQGWLGLYPLEAQGSLTFGATDHSRAAASLPATMGNDPAEPESSPRPEESSYSVRLSAPHLSIQGAGTIAYVGGGAIKFQGPDVEIVASENRTTYRTTFEREDAPVLAERVERWVLVEFTRASLEIDSSLSYDLRLPAATAQIDGGLSFRAHDLAPTPRSESQASYARFHRFAGPLDAALSPEVVRGDARMLLSLWRPAQETSGVDTLAATLAKPSVATPLILTGSLLALGGVGAVLVQRRRSMAAPTPEELVALATIAAEAGRYGESLEWIRRARRLAPASSRLLEDEAFYLGRLGRVEEALATYDEAAALTSSGDPDFQACLLVLGCGGDLVLEVEPRLVRALTRSPELLQEVEQDDTFTHLMGRPLVRQAVRAARARLRE